MTGAAPVDLKTFEDIYAEARKKHPHLPESCTDLTNARGEARVRIPFLEDWAVSSGFIEDPRDKIMVSLSVNIVVAVFGMHIALFLYPSHKLGIATVVTVFLGFFQRFVLMMHYSQHRRLFKMEFMTHFFTTVLAPFFGIPPGFYWLHHVVMHHLENNIFPFDLSSTEAYQRDNFFHFLHYLAKFWTCIIALPYYAFKNGRARTAFNAAASFGLMVAAICLGWSYNRLYFTYGFVVPFALASFFLMFGNFSQHIFVDPSVATMPQNLKSYEFNAALTYQCMNHFDNLATFNDGYHVTHHINSRCHWAEMAVAFWKNVDKYVAADTILFTGTHFFEIGIFVFTGQWSSLAKHYVHWGPEKLSEEQVIAKLKARLVPIHRKPSAGGGIARPQKRD